MDWKWMHTHLPGHSQFPHRISVKCMSQKLEHITYSNASSFNSCAFQFRSSVTGKWYIFHMYILQTTCKTPNDLVVTEMLNTDWWSSLLLRVHTSRHFGVIYNVTTLSFITERCVHRHFTFYCPLLMSLFRKWCNNFPNIIHMAVERTIRYLYYAQLANVWKYCTIEWHHSISFPSTTT